MQEQKTHTTIRVTTETAAIANHVTARINRYVGQQVSAEDIVGVYVRALESMTPEAALRAIRHGPEWIAEALRLAEAVGREHGGKMAGTGTASPEPATPSFQQPRTSGVGRMGLRATGRGQVRVKGKSG